MKKKIIAVLLSFLLVFTLAGCGKKDPVDRLKETFDKSVKMESATQEFDMILSMDMSESDPELDMIMAFLSDVKLTGKMDVDNKKMALSGSITADLGGMAYTMEMYRDEDFYIKVPILPQYLILEDAEAAQNLFDSDFVMEITKESNKIMSSYLNKNNVKAMEDIDYEKNGEKIKLTPIEFKLSEEESKAMFTEVLDTVYSNPKFLQQMEDNFKKEMEAFGDEMSQEELDEIFAESLEMMQNMSKIILVPQMDSVYYLDAKNNIRKTDIDMIMEFNMAAMLPEEMTEDVDLPLLSVKIKGTTDIYNINNVKDMYFPELTEENSIKMDQMQELGGLF